MRNMVLALAAACLAAVSEPAAASGVARETARPDGSVISWSLDRQGGDAKQGVLVLAQGSGCQSVAGNQNITRAKSLLPSFAVVTVEKYGVKPGDAPADPYEGCSASFYAHHTVSQRTADYQRVLDVVAQEPWWDGQLVLFGGSEGGAVISMLAPQVKPSAVVVFSTAPGRSFRKIFKLVVPPHVAALADAEFAKIAADPQGVTVWGGNAYRWWADILDRDLTAELLAVEAPVLLVQGERDQSAPVAVAREVRDDFQRVGRCNLTYWELAGYDHHMRDPAGASHFDEVLDRISGWLAAASAGGHPVDCLD